VVVEISELEQLSFRVGVLEGFSKGLSDRVSAVEVGMPRDAMTRLYKVESSVNDLKMLCKAGTCYFVIVALAWQSSKIKKLREAAEDNG
jgi:hypothetical protein